VIRAPHATLSAMLALAILGLPAPTLAASMHGPHAHGPSTARNSTDAGSGSATGGASASSPGSGGSPSSADPQPGGGAAPGSPPSSSSAPDSGPGLTASPSALLGHVVRLNGSLGPSAAGKGVLIQRFDSSRQSWVTAAHATADSNGSFVARWRTDRVGRFAVRAIGASGRSQASAADAPPSTQLTVYRPAVATWYGPGFYGRRTACGRRMTPSLMGVASRSLPCGTHVEISYQGRSVTVAVVDRGPYSSAKWDLTHATARQLGFSGRAVIGTLATTEPLSASTPG